MSDFEPFYDVSRSYEDNYEQGPFGAFAEALKDGNGADAAGTTSEGASEGALATFLGQPVNLPFGIPAGPLLNSRFTTAAFRMGFDLATYKTVRSRAWGCNPFPNVLGGRFTNTGQRRTGRGRARRHQLRDSDLHLQ